MDAAGRPPTPKTPLARVHQGHFQLGEPLPGSGGPPFHHPSISPQHSPDDPATQASVSADRLHPGRSTCFLPWDARAKQHLDPSEPSGRISAAQFTGPLPAAGSLPAAACPLPAAAPPLPAKTAGPLSAAAARRQQQRQHINHHPVELVR